jgi:tetratricopeptide (TPR) repeat protein
VHHILGLARSAGEVYDAVPRRDPVLDVADEMELAQAAMTLCSIGKGTWAQSILARAGSLDGAGQEALYQLSVAARTASKPDLADRFAEAALEKSPEDSRVLMLRVNGLRDKRDYAGARATIEKALKGAPEELVVPFLRELLLTAIAEESPSEARAALKRLRGRMPPSFQTEIELARHEASVATLEGKREDALIALDRAIEMAPYEIALRKQRADLLTRFGRTVEASADLAFIHSQEERPK